MKKYWYLAVLLLAALVINENVIQWALAVKVGGHSISEGYSAAFKYFSWGGFLFFAAFRLVPYVCLGILLVILSKTRFRDYVLPALTGGLVGVLTMIIGGSWNALRPLYTEEHASSTTAVCFIWIPVYAAPVGVIGGLLLAAVCAPFRYVLRRGKTE